MQPINPASWSGVFGDIGGVVNEDHFMIAHYLISLNESKRFERGLSDRRQGLRRLQHVNAWIGLDDGVPILKWYRAVPFWMPMLWNASMQRSCAGVSLSVSFWRAPPIFGLDPIHNHPLLIGTMQKPCLYSDWGAH
jgi:hypothetical protein